MNESNGVINIVSFDNLGFSQEISKQQEQFDKEKEKNNIINDPDNKVISVSPEENEKVWDSLTDEEKAKILEGIE